MRLRDLTDKSVVIWGAGREAQAVINAVRRAGVRTSISVVDEDPTGEATVCGIEVIRGSAATQTLVSADVIVRSPGVSSHRSDVMRVIDSVPEHTTATNLWFAEERARRERGPSGPATKSPRVGDTKGQEHVIAVTGTKGKSTTSSLIACLLRAVGNDVILAGNIGHSPLDHLDDPEPDWWVLELSSFQTSDLVYPPDIAVLTSLSPEHLDWHGDEATYFRDKLNLFSRNPDVLAIVNGTDPGASELGDTFTNVRWSGRGNGVQLNDSYFVFNGEPLFGREALALSGRHNADLTCVALTTIAATDIDLLANAAALENALTQFSPLAHRLCPIPTRDGILWIDDGLSTTPIAARAALEAFSDRAETVLLGGYDRGQDYSALIEYLIENRDRVAVVTMPDSGGRIADAIETLAAENGGLVLHRSKGLEGAVEIASRITPSGGVVLFSPGAPSFGQFRNYEERSAAYIELVGTR